MVKTHLWILVPPSCLAPPSPTPSPASSSRLIPWKVLTSASRCFSIFHCCSPGITEWAGSVFRSSCFSRVTAASYSPSVKCSGRNSPVSPLPFFFPVTYEGRRWPGQKSWVLSWVCAPQRKLREASGPPSPVTAPPCSALSQLRLQRGAAGCQDSLQLLVLLS